MISMHHEDLNKVGSCVFYMGHGDIYDIVGAGQSKWKIEGVLHLKIKNKKRKGK